MLLLLHPHSFLPRLSLLPVPQLLRSLWSRHRWLPLIQRLLLMLHLQLLVARLSLPSVPVLPVNVSFLLVVEAVLRPRLWGHLAETNNCSCNLSPPRR